MSLDSEITYLINIKDKTFILLNPLSHRMKTIRSIYFNLHTVYKSLLFGRHMIKRPHFGSLPFVSTRFHPFL